MCYDDKNQLLEQLCKKIFFKNAGIQNNSLLAHLLLFVPLCNCEQLLHPLLLEVFGSLTVPEPKHAAIFPSLCASWVCFCPSQLTNGNNECIYKGTLNEKKKEKKTGSFNDSFVGGNHRLLLKPQTGHDFITEQS